MGTETGWGEVRGRWSSRMPTESERELIPMVIVVLERGHKRTAALVNERRAKRKAGMLTNLDRTLDIWLKMDSVPFMLIEEWTGRGEGLYLMARSEEALLKTVVPYAMAHALAKGRRCAFVMGTDDALADRLQKAVAVIEESVWPEGTPSEPISFDDAEFDEPFETEVGHLVLYFEAAIQSTSAAHGANSQLRLAKMRRGDGWFELQAQHPDGRETRLMVPPTHWRYRGAPPPIEKRPLVLTGGRAA